jgi:hypothetical protein
LWARRAASYHEAFEEPRVADHRKQKQGPDIGADGVHAVDPKMWRELDDELSHRFGRSSSARIGCHTFRATGITAYLEAGGTLENAQAMAAHESPRTTKLYDRTGDEITLDEVERITI